MVESLKSNIRKTDRAAGRFDSSTFFFRDKLGVSLVFFGLIALGFSAALLISKSVALKSIRSQFAVLGLAFVWTLFLTKFAERVLISTPTKRLVRFLDELRTEDELPSELPDFGSGVPELALISKSLENLFQRLRDYRVVSLKRLLLEKRQSEIIATAISDGVFLLRDDEILYVNPVANKILGLFPQSFVKGLRLNNGSPSTINSLGLNAISKAISSSLPVEFSLEFNEKKQHYLLQAFPLSNDLIEEVEHLVNDATEEFLDRFQANILVLAQDVTLVREGQEAKSHFLATLSHEVKTPVTSLTMATRLLKKSVDQFSNPTHRSLIMTCSDDVDRLRRLLDDLLSVSRFDTLTQKLAIQDIDLAKLVLHSVQSFQMQARERGVQLVHRIESQGKPVVVPMDAAKIAWALSNLIINALRHTPRGGKIEAIVVLCEEWVELRIRDSGPGIERHRQERIFDKFNPYYDLRVARSGSVGAGLAIAREIVAAHGGRIWVVSEQGHGAEFCFSLPLRRQKKHLLPDENVTQPVNEATGLLSGKS